MKKELRDRQTSLPASPSLILPQRLSEEGMRRRQQPAHVADGGDPGPGCPAGALKLAAEQSLRGCFWDTSPPSPWALDRQPTSHGCGCFEWQAPKPEFSDTSRTWKATLKMATGPSFSRINYSKLILLSQFIHQ